MTTTSPDESPFARLIELRDAAEEINQQLHEEANRLNKQEHRSWADVGEALGVSRQAVWERFAKPHNARKAASESS